MKNRELVMIVAGTRPEAIKLAPVIEWLDRLRVDYVFVWSGQHYDYEMSKIFFEQLGLPEPDENLDIRSGSHAEQTAKIMMKLDKVVDKYNPSMVVAQGDTNTTVATALTAIKKLVPFAHVEAGLRSWDRTMPEEINRIVADAIAELHFAPTELAAINLMHEGIPIKKIHITGNTIVDVVLKHKDKALQEGRKLLEKLNLQSYEYILVTIHRQENTDNPHRLTSITRALIKLAKHYPVTFPVHPRTMNKLKQYNLYEKLLSNKNIILLKPLGYFQFLGLLAQTKVVLTDSGGVQEEACTLKTPTVTLRYNTERSETVQIGINKIVGTETKAIVTETIKTIKTRSEIIEKARKTPNPLGNGNAGEKIAKILELKISMGLRVDFTDNREDPYITYVLLENTETSTIAQTITSEYDCIALYSESGLPVTDPTKAVRLVLRAPIQKAISLIKRCKSKNDESSTNTK